MTSSQSAGAGAGASNRDATRLHTPLPPPPLLLLLRGCAECRPPRSLTYGLFTARELKSSLRTGVRKCHFSSVQKFKF